MKLMKTVVGPIQTNCYLLTDDTIESKPTAIIDPGDEPDRIVGLIRRDKLTPACILLTHGHFDHVTGIPGIRQYYPDIPVYIHAKDADLAINGSEYSDGGIGPVPFTYYAEGDVVKVGNLELTVIQTPGHTPGSVCLKLDEKNVFTGDTLFQNSCGRTDFPGGSMDDMMKSLAKLVRKAPECSFYPGHGSSSTMENEFRRNYYILMALKQQ